MKVLGIDPGLAQVGWAILEKNSTINLIDYGCIKTNKTLAFCLRIEKIYQNIVNLINTHKPDTLAIEDLYFAKNVKTALIVAQVMGVIKLAGIKSNLKVVEYTPLNIKITITGYGKADKKQIEYMTSKLLSLKKKVKPDHAADATAVALTHLSTNLKLKA